MYKVNNKQVLSSLRETLELNTVAIDYVENEINRVSDILKYNENDEHSKNCLKNLQYINYTLRYLDKQYMKSYKMRGGKL